MLEQDYRNVSAWLEECQRPLLLTHVRPDGDALGSAGALAHVLRRGGSEPQIALFNPVPRRYSFLEEIERWHQWETSHEALCDSCDAVIIVDTCALAQLEPATAFLQSAPRTLVIDHHATHDPIGTRSQDLRLFDETACAASLIVAEWIDSTAIETDAELATMLFTGIATDSGWFRFSNTDARALGMAATLVEAGAEPNRLYSLIHEREPLEKLRLIARVLQKMELHADGRLAVMFVRPGDFEASGADATMTDDLVNEAARLASVEATILLTQIDDQSLRVNFRSKKMLDVSELARRFGGGGHARAAGARLQGDWDYVVPRLIAETIEAM